MNKPTAETIEHIARAEGVLLNPIYTSKVATGLLHWLNSGELKRDAEEQGYSETDRLNVLFLHTGGQTAMSAYQGQGLL